MSRLLTVPPIPERMTYFERKAWSLWRSGLSVSAAAEHAGITPNHLRLLLGHPARYQEAQFQTSQCVEETHV